MNSSMYSPSGEMKYVALSPRVEVRSFLVLLADFRWGDTARMVLCTVFYRNTWYVLVHVVLS